ncbi:hypothetical protein IWX46DRAFT_578686 [Phyllosticta citricarpa]|uniref:Uncharacterized protein n=1 Tax=Phyllosticta citricarpa TaxID=55181 RepID=A0ABR1MLM0_9PEZI
MYIHTRSAFPHALPQTAIGHLLSSTTPRNSRDGITFAGQQATVSRGTERRKPSCTDMCSAPASRSLNVPRCNRSLYSTLDLWKSLDYRGPNQTCCPNAKGHLETRLVVRGEEYRINGTAFGTEAASHAVNQPLQAVGVAREEVSAFEYQNTLLLRPRDPPVPVVQDFETANRSVDDTSTRLMVYLQAEVSRPRCLAFEHTLSGQAPIICRRCR